MGFRSEVIPFLLASVASGAGLALVMMFFRRTRRFCGRSGIALAVVACAYMLFFFRDPERRVPASRELVVAAADGVIAGVKTMREDRYLQAETVRISIFLSLFDVHVNRSPIEGASRFLGYFPGKHFFTFQEKSSDHNQHNAILIEGSGTRCLLYQIVGPVCRRVVYWPDPEQPVPLQKGERLGMMKFGSRLDMYFPVADVEVLVREGERVRAGESVIATLTGAGKP